MLSSRTIKKSERGYATLVSVLLVGAIAGSVSVFLLYTAVDTAKTESAFIQSALARAYAHACSEQGLELIREGTSYTGTGSLTFDRGSCTYTVTNTGGVTRQVTASGTVGTVVRRMTVTVSSLNPKIVLSQSAETP